MKYLIVQDWSNTRGNHAGMEHMCDMLVERFPYKYKKFVNAEEKRSPIPSNKIFRIIRRMYDKYYYGLGYVNRYKRICKQMLKDITEGDEVFLLEYLFPVVPQYGFALYLRDKYPWLKIYALSHLSPSLMALMGISKDLILKWSQPVDKMLTLGSSLSSYLKDCGIPSEKISTGFHYVDNDYYYPENACNKGEEIKILCLGAVQRNNMLMAEIIKSVPQVKWLLCRGNNKQIDYLYENCKNIILKGFMSEQELKETMNECNVSLNVMDDTIGSNVITTSMAMGLAIIVSDVGSIRDYCSPNNAVFCKNTKDSFVEAILSLIKDKDKLCRMQNESLVLSQNFCIANIDNWFSILSDR